MPRPDQLLPLIHQIGIVVVCGRVRPLSRTIHQTGPDWISFYVLDHRSHHSLATNTPFMIAILPQRSTHTQSGIDSLRTIALYSVHYPGQGLIVLRCNDYMEMVRHKHKCVESCTVVIPDPKQILAYYIGDLWGSSQAALPDSSGGDQVGIASRCAAALAKCRVSMAGSHIPGLTSVGARVPLPQIQYSSLI